MKLINLKISNQLNIGMGIILLFVVLLGGISFFNINNEWQNTEALYNHPFTVQRAIGKTSEDVLNIRVVMKELVTEKNDQKVQDRIIAISSYEADINKQLEVLYSAYLGPKSDIDEVNTEIVKYKVIRDEIIRLFKEGNITEAAKRVNSDGIGGITWQRVMTGLNRIDTFASNKANQFYTDARNSKNGSVLHLGIVLGVILFLSGGISLFLRKGMMKPLKEMTTATRDFHLGKFETRSHYVSTNEFGVLSKAFNSMAESVQSEIENKENIAKLSFAMMLQDDLHVFCISLLKSIIKNTGSEVGAVYLLNNEKTYFEHFESIGLNENFKTTFSATKSEGEFGGAIATHKIQRIVDIPNDTEFIFSTVIGSYRPKEIITIPVINGADIVAIISLASIKNYSVSAIRLVNDIWRELTARFNGVLAYHQINEYSHKLQLTNNELEAQSKELSVQADELTEQNIELEMQKKLLDEASQLKSSFLSNMSHELRTPLNSVIALSSVLSRRLKKSIPDEEYSYLEVIERNGKNLLALVNDILDISRIEAGKEEITISNFTISELVGEIVEMLTPQAREKELVLLNHVEEGLPRVNSDMSKCTHIIQNIMSNAVKFTNTGSVEIRAQMLDKDFEITITDTGIGISEDQLRYIFDEFRQADETTSRKYGGTGLGLAIAKKYAGLLGGTITVTSVLGEGSTFILRLPQNAGSITPTAKASTFSGVNKTHGGNTPLSGKGKNILLVEDSEPAIIQMKDILTEKGYKVAVARDGKEALATIEKMIPDAMILDLMMPEVDGFKVLRAVRSVEKTSEIPVLILTAKHVTKEELSFLKGNHIFQLIQKGSVGKDELLSAVGNMVLKQNDIEIPPSPKAIMTKHNDKPAILVVEDNADNITTVKALLNEMGDIMVATDGQMGINYARHYKPSLILLDISLPVMDGFKVLKQLKSDETLENIPVIALTARAMAGDREGILALGFDGYVSKPIDAEQFEKTIRGILDAK